ncbi:hypothetical protein [Marivita sp. GX14005]|uniref:hypothetical protein n=1 Tax=Marivita sp. GX14005 TaxID=2942276 RepID=UPI0020188398|nr:hypothetical protein [Marivita sp. GX14005]MCL3882673.1 hypothetical protein [Marivita sp. GX14005]
MNRRSAPIPMSTFYRVALMACAVLAASPALSFDLTPVVDPADIVTDHPYRILDLAPGASYDELEAAASARGIPLYPQEGIMTVTMNGTQIGLNVTYGYQTHGYDNPYLYQNETKFEFMQGFLSTNATGNVAVSVSRSMGIPLPEAPSLDALRKQVIQEFGEPTFMDKDLGFDRAIWIHSVDGEKIAAGETTAMPENCGGPAQFQIVDPETVVTGCSVVYEVAFKQMGTHTLIRFTITDYALRDRDRIEAAKQITDAITGTGDDAPSKLDL